MRRDEGGNVVSGTVPFRLILRGNAYLALLQAERKFLSLSPSRSIPRLSSL